MTMENMLTDAVAEALTKKVTEKLLQRLNLQWGNVITELAETRETNTRLTSKVEQLERQLTQQTRMVNEQLSNVANMLQWKREEQHKASQVLDAALKSMGLGE